MQLKFSSYSNGNANVNGNGKRVNGNGVKRKSHREELLHRLGAREREQRRVFRLAISVEVQRTSLLFCILLLLVFQVIYLSDQLYSRVFIRDQPLRYKRKDGKSDCVHFGKAKIFSAHAHKKNLANQNRISRRLPDTNQFTSTRTMGHTLIGEIKAFQLNFKLRA